MVRVHFHSMSWNSMRQRESFKAMFCLNEYQLPWIKILIGETSFIFQIATRCNSTRMTEILRRTSHGRLFHRLYIWTRIWFHCDGYFINYIYRLSSGFTVADISSTLLGLAFGFTVTDISSTLYGLASGFTVTGTLSTLYRLASGFSGGYFIDFTYTRIWIQCDRYFIEFTWTRIWIHCDGYFIDFT